MFKNLLSKVGWGELPSSFGFTVGEKVELPFHWQWELHKGQKRSDGSPVSVFICGKKDLDSAQVAAAKNAEQMAKSLRHPNILRALDSIEVEGGFYLVTEVVVPLLSQDAPEEQEGEGAVWGLHQALDALSFLHASGFTHGLFGPASIFVTPQGDYRLGGFELCRKGADAGALLKARKRSGPSITGWPDPPSSLADGGAPTVGVDLWGAAVMTAYVFGSARAGRHGVDFRVDLVRAAQDVPADLRKPFAELQRPGPLRGKSPVAELLGLQYFQQHPTVRVMSFLASLHIKSPEEKDAFFDGLPVLLEGVPQTMQTRQVLPELLTAQKFPGQEAAQVLPSILKIGVRLKDDEFKEKVAPLVAQLFASPDRAIRFRLLSSLGDMIDHLDEQMINDKIFPECVNGFTDSNGPIREATVKSLVHFVPRLKAKTVEGRVVKILSKLLQDPEASIRTNAVICTGRISSHLPKSCAGQALLGVLSAGLKDGFGPCRSAALQTLLATASVFSAEELANRMMPGVCHRLVDPDPTVSDAAFQVVGGLQQHLRQLVDERRAAQAAEGFQAGGAAPAEAPKDTGQQGGWGSWAFSTVGSVVGQKIMGSMGPAKGVAGAEGASGSPAAAPTVEAASAVPAPPPTASAGSGGTSRGMSLGGKATQRTTASSSSVDLGFGDESDAIAGAGWGDDDDEFWGSVEVPAEGAGRAGGGAAAAEPPPKQQAAPPPAAPMAGRSTAAAKGTGTGASMRLGPAPASAAPQAKAAAAAPKATAKALDSQEDDDFWKEFGV